MDRIATFSHQNQLVRNLMQNEAKLAKAQLQQSSQLKSDTYAGIADQTSELVNLESYMARSQRYVDQGEIVDARITETEKVVKSLLDIAAKTKALVAALKGSGLSTPESIADQARGLLNDFASQLNKQFGGRYLFGGGVTDKPPVSIDASAYPPLRSPSTPTTSYYSGDDTKARFRADDDLTVEYGVTANDPAIEKVMRALNLLANMPTNPVNTNLVNEASNLADSGETGLNTLQSKLSSASLSIENSIDRHLNEQLTLQSRIDDLAKVDLAAMSVRVTQLEALLEASVQVMSAMKAFSLRDLL